MRTANMVMLAHNYNGIFNHKGWLASEKLDGVRAVWDGTQLVTRTGKVLHAPQSFLMHLPHNVGYAIDGELWEGIGMFQQTVGKVRAHHGDWSSIKFMAFDLVDTQTNFDDRLDMLLDIETENSFFTDRFQVVDQVTIHDEHDLLIFEQKVLQKHGEGVMLKNPLSYYEDKRSKNLLKVKRFITTEGVVVGFKPGEGKHEGRVGAYELDWGGSTTVFVGTGMSDAEREIGYIKLGDKITFSYFELTDAGVPRFPSFVCKRDYE